MEYKELSNKALLENIDFYVNHGAVNPIPGARLLAEAAIRWGMQHPIVRLMFHQLVYVTFGTDTYLHQEKFSYIKDSEVFDKMKGEYANEDIQS